jgi:hypothetical protein
MNKKALPASLALILLISMALSLSNEILAEAIDPPSILWAKTYPEFTSGSSVIQTKEGNLVLGGYVSNINGNGFLVQTDPEGNTIWSKTYQGIANSWVSYILQINDGGYAIVLSSEAAGKYSWASLIKTDSIGNQIWAKTYGNELTRICSVVQTSDGNLVLGGSIGTFMPQSYSSLLVKMNLSGEIIWNKTYDQLYASSMIQTINGGFALAGTSAWGLAGKSGLLVTDSEGNELWSQSYGDFYSHSLIQTNDEGFTLIGRNVTTNEGMLIRTDSNGNMLWGKISGGTSGNYLTYTSDGGYAWLDPGFGSAYIIKTDSTGNLQWNQSFEGLNQFAKTNDGGYALAGNYPGIEGTFAWLSKLSSSSTPTPNPTPSPTPTATPSPSPSPTLAPTPTPTITPTTTPSPTPTDTPTPTLTPTASPTDTPTPTLTPTASPTSSPTQTPTPTSALSPPPTPTVTPKTSTPTTNPMDTTTPTPTETADPGIPLIYVGVVVSIISVATIAALLGLKFVRKRSIASVKSNA